MATKWVSTKRPAICPKCGARRVLYYWKHSRWVCRVCRDCLPQVDKGVQR